MSNGLKTTHEPRRYAFLVAAILAFVAIAFVALNASTQFQTWVEVGLSVLAILTSSAAASIVSYSWIHSQVKAQHNEQIGQVVAIAATTMNDFTHKITRLQNVWEKVSEEQQVKEDVAYTFSQYLSDFWVSTQSATDLVANLNPDKENPFDLSRFAHSAPCPVNSCNGVIEFRWLQPSPRSTAYTTCPECGQNSGLTRRSDGTIATRPVAPQRIPGTASGERFPTVEVTCPNVGCNAEFLFSIDPMKPVTKNPCPRCKRTVSRQHANGALISEDNPNTGSIEQKRMKIGNDGEYDYPCGCGSMIGIQHAVTDSEGKPMLACFKCGAAHTDRSGVFEKLSAAPIGEVDKAMVSKETAHDIGPSSN